MYDFQFEDFVKISIIFEFPVALLLSNIVWMNTGWCVTLSQLWETMMDRTTRDYFIMLRSLMIMFDFQFEDFVKISIIFEFPVALLLSNIVWMNTGWCVTLSQLWETMMDRTTRDYFIMLRSLMIMKSLKTFQGQKRPYTCLSQWLKLATKSSLMLLEYFRFMK